MRNSCLSKAGVVLISFLVASIMGAPSIKETRDSSMPMIVVTRGSEITGNTSIHSPVVKRDLIGELFPVSGVEKQWTTADGAPNALPLSDKTLRPHNIASGIPYSYGQSYGKSSLKAHYPKGSYKPSASPKGGISFYASGPSSVDLSTAREATFGYSVMFPTGFDFVKGGKLPGIYGGDDDQVALSCSGGRKDAACFSVRLMWRTGGAGEIYTYLPPYTDPRFAANEKQCTYPNSECNDTYGDSIGRGNYKFTPGVWTTVSQRVKLNSVGKADGELELFVGGKSVINISGLILRDGSAGKMRGIQVQTFFGGSTSDWATPKDQDVFFADFSVGILSTL